MNKYELIANLTKETKEIYEKYSKYFVGVPKYDKW